MSRSKPDDRATRTARVAAIRACRRCDPSGWLLGPDRTPIDPAVRCDHRPPATPPAIRDITEPIHQPDDNDHHQPEGNHR